MPSFLEMVSLADELPHDEELVFFMRLVPGICDSIEVGFAVVEYSWDDGDGNQVIFTEHEEPPGGVWRLVLMFKSGENTFAPILGQDDVRWCPFPVVEDLFLEKESCEARAKATWGDRGVCGHVDCPTCGSTPRSENE